MESDNAHKTLLRISKEKDFALLETYLKRLSQLKLIYQHYPWLNTFHQLL